MFRHLDAWDDHEQVYALDDRDSGLSAVVAIHSTRRGPAVGGTRFRRYEQPEDAVTDALRLSQAMTYKAALAGVPFGGGKAVIMDDGSGIKSDRLLAAYGRMLNRIGDLFATGEDVGFSLADCEALKAHTLFVAGTSSRGRGDPSIYTAEGVRQALRTVAKRLFGASDCAGLRIGVQGLGGVGWSLCERLAAEGAILIVADVRSDRAEAAAAHFGAEVVDPLRIHAETVDIWSPCALGAVINDATIGEIKSRAIVGAANNQLARPELAEAIRARGILLAPDILVSAGGILSGVEEIATLPGRTGTLGSTIEDRLEGIGRRLEEVLDMAEADQTTPHAAALALARRIVAER